MFKIPNINYFMKTMTKTTFGGMLQFCCLLFLAACTGGSGGNSPQEPDIAQTGNPAIDALTLEIAKDPTNAILYAGRGEAFYENDGYDNAILDMTKAIKLDSTQAEFYHVLGDAYLDYSRSRLALKTMERAAELFPTRIPTLLKLSEFQLILKKYQDALKTTAKVLEVDPQNADAYFMMGMNFKEMNDPNRAINSFQTAVENDPDMIEAWVNLGNLFSQQDNPLAEKYFDNAIRVDSSSVTALHAKAYYLGNKKNDLEGALALYRKINIIDQQYEEAFYNAGLLYMDLGKFDKGREQFDLCTKASPTHIRAYYYRGFCNEKLGNMDAAAADYKQALQFYPEYAQAQEGLLRVQK